MKEEENSLENSINQVIKQYCKIAVEKQKCSLEAARSIEMLVRALRFVRTPFLDRQIKTYEESHEKETPDTAGNNIRRVIKQCCKSAMEEQTCSIEAARSIEMLVEALHDLESPFDQP